MGGAGNGRGLGSLRPAAERLPGGQEAPGSTNRQTLEFQLLRQKIYFLNQKGTKSFEDIEYGHISVYENDPVFHSKH